MGGRGSGGVRNTDSSPIKLGGSITQLEKYTSYKDGGDNIRKDFNLNRATESQIESLRQMFKGILEYDRGYDDSKTPYNVMTISITPISSQTPEDLALNKRLTGRSMEQKEISILIRTEPNVDNPLIRSWDTKYRNAILGRNGGFHTYDNNGKRKSIKPFDIRYGAKDLL